MKSSFLFADNCSIYSFQSLACPSQSSLSGSALEALLQTGSCYQDTNSQPIVQIFLLSSNVKLFHCSSCRSLSPPLAVLNPNKLSAAADLSISACHWRLSTQCDLWYLRPHTFAAPQMECSQQQLMIGIRNVCTARLSGD